MIPLIVPACVAEIAPVLSREARVILLVGMVFSAPAAGTVGPIVSHTVCPGCIDEQFGDLDGTTT